MGQGSDAGAGRASERQTFIEAEQRKMLEMLKRGDLTKPIFELLLVMELFRRFKGNSRIILESDAQTMATIRGAAHVAERHLGRQAASSAEYNFMLLTLAKRMLETASVDIEAKFAEWRGHLT